jgi:putative two-component system response regulator
VNKVILIVDDMEIDRTILAEAFRDEWEILEADSGRRALQILEERDDISAVLLDLMMPQIGGIQILRALQESGRTGRTPVFILTAEEDENMLLEAYELGAVDVIRKPFMMKFIRCRIQNIIELYAHRNDMEKTINEQIERLHRQNSMLVETLASIIEFRDCESGEHVKRIRTLTRVFMMTASQMYPEYFLPEEEIEKITMAAVLHDVGKISIPDRILNKPGRLTKEEFEIMKGHTVKGCEILEQMPEGILDGDVFEYCYDICRQHHERWDGKGYPDGLSGDDISIWAQIVSVADVYDALTSPRVYKAAFDHETAVRMILGGECGTFNPKVLEVFKQSLDIIKYRSTPSSTKGGYSNEKETPVNH